MKFYIDELSFYTQKPMIYLINMSSADFKNKYNPWLPKIQKWIDKNARGSAMILYSATYEAEYLFSKQQQLTDQTQTKPEMR